MPLQHAMESPTVSRPRSLKSGGKTPPMSGKDTRAYITVTNELFDHPKFKRIKNPWARLHLIELWTYCNRYKTDGVIDEDALMEKGDDVGEELLKRGWVHGPNADGDYQMHDYLKHQKSKAEIEGLTRHRTTAAQYGNHTRWHEAKDVFEASCGFCTGDLEAPKGKTRKTSVGPHSS
ncbi:hypothetical protein SEA_COLUCCI_51 [Arthrobacter phage Colucci]|uniref:Uncharacterized protein n=1 Tax=Arthrobacter phage Colucci TaxID=2015834 RepID=A0A286N2W4_9CAUD|nr:replication initiation protein [Arthrobacter phage Colucci]ASX98721.1 hypothetical protein SEA_COLUCCI_51 [Arthrobacter phage Colucci]